MATEDPMMETMAELGRAVEEEAVADQLAADLLGDRRGRQAELSQSGSFASPAIRWSTRRATSGMFVERIAQSSSASTMS